MRTRDPARTLPFCCSVKTKVQTRITCLKTRTSYISEKLKTSLCAETKAWRVAYGKLCNTKYLNEMEFIFSSIEDWVKRLNRPIKDLDDIRLAMETLKEIREKEITIDMMIGPIEVPYTSCFTCSISYL